MADQPQNTKCWRTLCCVWWNG